MPSRLLQADHENWGFDHSIHAMKKDATWLPFVRLKPERDPLVTNEMAELREKKNVDELLRVKSRFLSVSTPEVTSQPSTMFTPSFSR